MAALLATTALVAVALTAPDRAAAQTLIDGTTNVPPNIVETGVLTVTGILNVNNTGTVETQDLDVDGGTVNVENGGTLTILGTKTTENGGGVVVESGGTVNAGPINHQGQVISVLGTMTSGDMVATGTFDVRDGGSYTVSGTAMYGSNSSSVVLGSGAILHVTGTLTVALTNSNYLRVAAGGALIAESDVFVSGTSNLESGFDGPITVMGALTVSDSAVFQGSSSGSAITVHGAIVIQDQGRIRSAGSFDALGTTTVGGTGELQVDGGTYDASGPVTIAGGTVTIGPSGTLSAIVGLIGSNGTDDTLVIDGTLIRIGTVGFRSGNDTLSIATGASISIDLVFDGGGDTDTLRLTGTGTRTEDMSRFQNFEIVEKKDAGFWTLVGGSTSTPTTVQSITVDSGSLVLLGIWKATGNTTTVNAGTTLTVGDGGAQSLLEEAQGLAVHGTLSVTNNGAVTVGGDTTVLASGRVEVLSGGTFNAQGVTLDGQGALATLSMQSGAQATTGALSVTDGYLDLTGASLAIGGDLSLTNSSFFPVSGSTVTVAGAMTVTGPGSGGVLGSTVTVSGPVTFTGGATSADVIAFSILAYSGNPALFVAESTTSFGGFSSITIVNGGTYDARGAVTVRDQAQLVVADGGAFLAGSAVTVRDTAVVTIADTSIFSASGGLVIQDSALVYLYGGGTLEAPQGVTLEGGTFNAAGPLVNYGAVGGTIVGTVDNIAGTLSGVARDLVVNPPIYAPTFLLIQGSYTQGAQARMAAFVQPPGTPSSLLIVQGQVTLAGNIEVVTDGGFALGDQVRFLASDRAIAGMFDTASLRGDIGSLTAVVLKTNDVGAISPTGNNVDVLIVDPGDRSTGGLTGNRRAIASVLGGALPSGGIVVQNDAVVAALFAPSNPQILDQLSPEPYDGFTAFSFEVARQFGGLVDSRVRGLRGGGGAGAPGLFASAPRDPVLIADTSPGGTSRPKAPGDYSNGIGPRPSGWSVWASGLGSNLWLESTANNLGYRGWTTGGAAGVDLRLARGFVLGVLAGGTRSNIDFNGVSGDGDMESVTTGVYAAWVGKHLFANTAFTYTKNWVEADRDITAMDTTATGKTEGNQYAVHATLGAAFMLRRLSIEASGGIDWVTLRQDGFTETGAGALNLTVDSRSDDSLRLRVGIRLARAFRVRPGLVVVPSGRVGYAREMFDNTRPITATLTGVGGAFTVTGDEGGRDFVTYGGGLQARWSQGLTLYFDYAGEWATDRTANTFTGGLRVSW